MRSSPSHSLLGRRSGAVLAAGVTIVLAIGVVLAIRGGERMKSLDEPAFLDIAANLAGQARFAHTNHPDVDGYDPELPLGALRPTAYRAPGYAFFIAPFVGLGGGYRVLRIVNALLLALTMVLVYRFLERKNSRDAAALAVLMVTAYPVLLYAASTLYPQTLSGLLLVASVVALERLHRKAGLVAFAGAGLVYGLLILTVPVYLLLTPIVLLWLLWTGRARVGQAALAGLVVAACVGAWTARNFLVFRSPVAMGTSSGFMLLSGNCPNTRHDQASVDVRWPEYVYTELTGKDEVERDKIMTRAALRFVTENPRAAAILYAKKLGYWFHYRNEVVSDRVVPGGAAAGPGWLRDAVMLLGYGALLGIALVRVMLVRRFPLTRLELLLIAMYVAGGMAYAVYLTRIRYRLPFDWLLIILDAGFLATLLHSRRDAAQERSVASLTAIPQ